MTETEAKVESQDNVENKEDKESEEKESPKVGKGYKYCKECKEVIGARRATCPKCKYVYPFKGKPRARPDSRRIILQNPDLNYNHENFTANNEANQEEQDENNPFKQDHSSFMKEKPCFVDIEPQQKQQMTTEVIDSYINESQLLLNSAFEQISNYGDLDSAAKILNRTLINLTYLATLCDSNDHHQDKCPDLNDFI